MSLDLDCDVNVKIGDFGLSRSCSMPLSEFLPTWQWLAPEIMSGFYDETSDIYSFGMVLYEIFYRVIPFSDMEEYIFKVFVEPPNPEKFNYYAENGFVIQDNMGINCLFFVYFRLFSFINYFSL